MFMYVYMYIYRFETNHYDKENGEKKFKRRYFQKDFIHKSFNVLINPPRKMRSDITLLALNLNIVNY